MTDPANPLGRFDLPFQEQIDFFRQKLNLPTEKWDDIWQEAHDRAFVVAGAMKADLLADLNRAVLRGIEQGTTLESFRDDFRQIVFTRGWHGWTGEGSEAGFNWRTKVIYETNLRSSYAAGREAQLADPGLQKLMPFRRYVHNDSVLHPRPLHLAWNGLTLPHDHPFWKTHSPPNGWGCRCRVAAAAAPRKGDPTEPPAGWNKPGEDGTLPGIDKGWGYAPGASVRDELRTLVEQKAAKLPAPLGKALATSVQQAPPAAVDGGIGRFLDVKGKGVAKKAMDLAIPAIDKVHRVDGLPAIPVVSSTTSAYQGAFRHMGTSKDAVDIRISTTSKNPGLTALHEIGHFIDHQSLNGKKGWASTADPLLEKWRTAVDGCAATNDLRAEMAKTGIAKARQLCGYYLQPHEQWARAYAQYVATRSGDQVLLAQLDAIRGSAHAVYRNSQWSDADFAPVAAAIDDLLVALGMK